MTLSGKIFAGSSMEGSNELFDEYIWSQPFEVRFDGTAAYIGIYSKNTGNVKYAVYDDDSTSNLLRYGTVSVTGGQWNFFALSSSLSVSYGDSVWICVLSDAFDTGAVAYTSQYSGTGLYFRSQSYSGYSYPSTFDWTTGTSNGYVGICAMLVDAVPTVAKKLTCYGDSMSRYPLWASYSEQVIQNQTLDFEVETVAIAGEYAEDLLADWSTNIGPIDLASGIENVFCLLAGINDIVVGDRSAADTFADIEDIWDAARTKGFNKIVAFTLTPYQYETGAQTTARLALNALIRASSNYDYLVDLANITDLQDASDTYYYFDGLHPTEQGAALFAAALTISLGVESRVLGERWPITERSDYGADTQGVARIYCPIAGRITKLGLYCGDSGNVKVHVYSGTSSAAGDLLYADDTGVAVSPCLNVIDIDDIDFDEGDWLWVGAISDTAGCLLYRSASNESRGERSISYSSFSAPDPAASLTYYTSTNALKFLAIGDGGAEAAEMSPMMMRTL